MDWTPPRTCTFVQHVIKFCGIFSVFLVDARTFRAGVLLPVTGSWPVGRTSAGAVTLALDHVNSDPTLTALRSGGHRIEFVWRDTQCDIGTGLTAMMEMKSNTSHPVDVFIGEQRYQTRRPDAGLMLAQNCRRWYMNPFKPGISIIIFTHYKPRTAVAFLDL